MLIKPSRDTILYARIQEVNLSWVKGAMRRWGYKSQSEFLDVLLADMQVMYPLKNGKKPTYDSTKSFIFGDRHKAKPKRRVRA